MADPNPNHTIINRGTQIVILGPAPRSRNNGKLGKPLVIATNGDTRKGEPAHVVAVPADLAKALKGNPAFKALVESKRYRLETGTQAA